jgi:nucleotide-binding universal stress UspA family protein
MDSAGSGRVVLGVANTLAGYEALRFAVQAARELRVPLVAVRAVKAAVAADAWPPLRQALHDAAAAEVARAFEEALGGAPGAVAVTVTTVSGSPHDVLPSIANRPDDLLVVGARDHRNWRVVGRAGVAGHCIRVAICPVVAVPTPTMARSGSATRLGRAVVNGIESYLDRAS